MEYSNPNDPWLHTPCDDTPNEGCVKLVAYLAAIFVALALFTLFTGCSTQERIVTVPEVHEHWHHTTDTVHRIDSVIDRQTTTIREVDSAAMAQYGIQMQAMQRAWLIETNRLQLQMSQLMEKKTDSVAKVDSIPYPVEVVKEVPAELSWWQSLRIWLGNIALLALLVAAGWFGFRLYRTLRFF